MISRVLVILVALQLVVTSAFAHVMPMPEHCVEPVAHHMHGEGVSLLQDQVVDLAFETEQQPKPLGLLHCASVACTDQFGDASVVDLNKDFRIADLNPSEPRMVLQSVLLSQLRPPLA
ncbi:hypothetical protein PhaeoP23_01737 [Phaeobacter piscinae]|uniref:DUF2946 domain-containing protein n=1 Tax=Phaeobacter piscinae TaxID=1580596 RepID=A0ABN5DFR8_9RHOB|nr:hypothetical protein [Phaeobacter piscinae]ATG35879.1 hypothetical protein PhaeoP36_01737 [Phaeobacter piscinae]AUQ86400.1 hypothetical protein PhaeoP42_01738 [Phaeobacter piscinae]AUR24283.1 hypothetical protein PhaeoP23_01737 [Phaeobacter piscinae]